MPPQTIESRVERLEHRVTELESLPDRVTAIESQIVQHQEMHGAFSAVREEIRAGDEETRRVLGERLDENGRHMRVLHEDVIGRLAIIQEGQSARRRTKGRLTSFQPPLDAGRTVGAQNRHPSPPEPHRKSFHLDSLSRRWHRRLMARGVEKREQSDEATAADQHERGGPQEASRGGDCRLRVDVDGAR